METKYQQSPRRLTKEDWKDLSEEWEASDINQAEFCKRKGVKLSAFVYWRQRVSQKIQRSKTKFLPAMIKGSSEKQCIDEGVILKLPNGMSLQMRSGVNKDFLKSIFELLGISAC